MTQVNFGAFNQDAFAQLVALAGSQSSAYNVAGPATLPQNLITGAMSVFVVSSNAAPGTQTTRTALQLYADVVAQFGGTGFPNGFSYDLQITNSGAGTFTLAGGTGVTISGTATVPTNTSRQFTVAVTPTSATITSVGSGTI